MDYLIRYPVFIVIFFGLLFCGTFFLWDMQPLMAYNRYLLREESKIKYTIQRVSTPVANPESIAVKKQEINQAVMQLVLSAKQTGISIRLVETKRESPGFATIHFVASGSLSNLFYFFEAIQKLKFLILVSHFSLSIISLTQIKFDAQINIHTAIIKNPLFVKFNPETSNASFLLPKNLSENNLSDLSYLSQPSLSSIPLRQMHFVGSFAQGLDHWAVLRLPNNQIIQVKTGDIIGAEKKQISHVSDDGISYERSSTRI